MPEYYTGSDNQQYVRNYKTPTGTWSGPTSQLPTTAAPTNNNLANRYAAPAANSGSVVSPIQPTGVGSTVNTIDSAAESYFASIPKVEDLETIRSRTRASMQGIIDNINSEYNRQRTEQGEFNARQDARTRGVNLAAGLAGSDFAGAAATETEKKGRGALDAIEQERGAKIGAALSQIEDRAMEESRFQRSEARQNLKDYVDFYQKRQTTAREDLKNLAGSGISLEQLTPDEYSKLLSQTGMDDFSLKAAFNQAKNAAEKIDYQWKIQGNKIFGYGLDPVTKKISTLEQELPFAVPAQYKPQLLDNGSMIFYPEEFDPNKPVKDQILSFDTGSPNDTKYLREVRGGLFNTRTNEWVIGPKADADDTDPIMMRDLQDAASAIEAGADADKVRQRFLDSHPKKGDLYLKYTKQAY